jgi:hypothetical protein
VSDKLYWLASVLTSDLQAPASWPFTHGRPLILKPTDHADRISVVIAASVSPLARPLSASALVVVELTLPAELHGVGHSALAAFSGSLADQLALKVGYGSKHCGQQPTLRTRSLVERPRRSSLVTIVTFSGMSLTKSLASCGRSARTALTFFFVDCVGTSGLERSDLRAQIWPRVLTLA